MEKLDNFKDLIQSLFLPNLKEDLDNCFLQSEHFQEYHKVLTNGLPLLFDFIQQNESLISSEVQETLEVRCSLLVLLCELSATKTVYQLKEDQLIKNANRLLSQHLLKTLKKGRKEPDQILSYYQEHLSAKCWKKNLGAVHGFYQLLKISFDIDKSLKLEKLPTSFITFCLSVGLNLNECHDPTYKEIASRIFCIILKNSITEDIQKMNIHGVIYDTAYKNIHSMHSVSSTNATWSCLFLCLEYQTDVDSFTWNIGDNMIEILISNITLTSSSDICITLFEFIPKICYSFSWNKVDIESNLKSFDNIEKTWQVCMDTTSYVSYRWAKNILQLIIAESYRLKKSSDVCKNLLQELLKSYLVCILPIRIEILKPHLVEFLHKFCTVLMENLTAYRTDKIIIKFIQLFFKTFFWQLQQSKISDSEIDLLDFKNSFELLLKNDIFEKN